MINKDTFHPITMADKAWIEEIFKNEYLEICDHTFGMSYAGRYTYNIQVGNVCGCAVYKYDEGDIHSFSYPVGKNSKEAVLELIKYIRESEDKLEISPASYSQRKELISLNIDDVIIEPYTDYFDYVYLADDLINLKGSKYSAKRNHINRFVESSNWSHEALSSDNTKECIQLVEEWRKTKEESYDDELIAEELEIKRSLESLDELGFFGSVIRKDDKIIAFSICEPQNKDTMIVHYEKAEADIQGAYQIINRETVSHAPGAGFKYVNREDDLGMEGLRKAKQSYHPYYMGRKYGIKISDVSFATENDTDELKKLWEIAFNDDSSYINEYFDAMLSENAIGQKWLNESVLVIRKNGHIAAMGSFIDAVSSDETKVKYVYGLATHPDYKMQGFCRRIIEFAKEYYDCPLVLKPADEELADMYKKMGFCDFAKELTLTDNIITKSDDELIDRCDYTGGLLIRQ